MKNLNPAGHGLREETSQINLELISKLLTDDDERFRIHGINLLLSRTHDDDGASLLRQALNDRSPVIRTLAAEGLSKVDPGSSARIMVSLLAERDPLVRQKASKALSHIYPPLIMASLPGFGEEQNNEIPAGDPIFNRAVGRSVYEGFIELLGLYAGSSEIPEYLLEEMVQFPGARGFFRSTLCERFSPSVADRFIKLCDVEEIKKYTKELTIAINYNCNHNCPYCFATDRPSSWEDDMTKEDFVSILEYLKAQGCSRVILTGGEPTLHPDFGLFLDILKERGFTCYFATNAFFTEDVQNRINKELVDVIGIHVEDIANYSRQKSETFHRNLKEICSKGIDMYLRCTIYSTKKKDWAPLADLCDKYNIRQINYAISFPNSDRSNAYISREEMMELPSILVEFVRTFADKGIVLRPVKPIPPCIFNPQDLALMIDHDLFNFGNGCTLHQRNCAHNLIVNPDLTIIPCIGLPIKGPKLFEFKTLEDAGGHYKETIYRLQRQPFFDKCAACSLYHGGTCIGGCLAYRMYETATC